MGKALDITGMKFNELTVIGLSHKRKLNTGFYDKHWLCKCSCGKNTTVRQQSITSGHTKSCGHLIGEYSRNQPKGAGSPSWKGGKHLGDGYVFIYMPDHPRAKKNGYIREHTVVMEKKIGRYLLPHENVHHIDGNKTNNSPENLELWSRSQPSGQRVSDKLSWAREIIKLYG